MQQAARLFYVLGGCVLKPNRVLVCVDIAEFFFLTMRLGTGRSLAIMPRRAVEYGAHLRAVYSSNFVPALQRCSCFAATTCLGNQGTDFARDRRRSIIQFGHKQR